MNEMKQTGLRWIGEIPSDWNIKKIKYVASLNGRIGWQGLTSEEYQDEGAYLITGTDFHNGGIDWERCVHVPMKRWEEARDIQIKSGDLLITKDGTVGKVAIVTDMPGETSLNSGVLRIIPKEGYSTRFLYWVLQSEEFWNWFNFKNSGNSTILHLYQGDFADFSYAFPCYREQESIADYLDEKCAKLDSVIQLITSQIETLRQHRKSLITEAITRGLNENVPMKNTGIAWIGFIPSHWEYKRIKYLLRSPLQYGANELGDDFNDEWPRYIRITDITEDNNLKDEGKESLPPKVAKPYLLREGDILFARSGATVGKTFFYREEYGLSAFAGYLIKACVNTDLVYPKFLYYSTLGAGYENWKNMSFSQATIQNIGADKYAQLIITVPPLNEQKEIINFLDLKCSKIKELLSMKVKELEAMEDYRNSLIYEYVTGKKRVEGVE